MEKKQLIEIKEMLFLILFTYFSFDLNVMKNINILLDNVIKEVMTQ